MWKYDICSQLISSSTAWGCGARRWCRHLGRPPNTEPWRPLIMSLKSININEIKDPCDNKLENPSNQGVTSLIKSSPCHSICLCLCLWLMWWTFFEIKWFESSCYMPMHTCLFVCLSVGWLFVCLCTCLFESMLINIHVRMHDNNQRDIGKLFHQHVKSDSPNLRHVAAFQCWPYPTFQGTAPPFKPWS